MAGKGTAKDPKGAKKGQGGNETGSLAETAEARCLSDSTVRFTWAVESVQPLQPIVILPIFCSRYNRKLAWEDCLKTSWFCFTDDESWPTIQLTDARPRDWIAGRGPDRRSTMM